MKISSKTIALFCLMIFASTLPLQTVAADPVAANDSANYVQDAYDAASRGAEIVFSYDPAGTYRIYCQDTFLTDIKLQPGEDIIYVGGGDTARWMVDKAQVGDGAQKVWHIYIKPLKRGISTNIIINTTRRTYQINARAGGFYNPMVSWSYPDDEKAAFVRQQAEDQQKYDDLALTVNTTKLNFHYHIKNKSCAWSPEAVFDDGGKTFIKMKPSVTTGTLPALFLVGEKNEAIIANYRVVRNYFVIDRLFDKAQLALGNDKVTIIKE